MMRSCGDCTLCCTLVPVRELGKPANTKCKHQYFKGCRVYRSKDMPMSCRVWSCRWLVNDDMGDQSRPDRSRVVVDTMPDFIRMQQPSGMVKLPVIQIWCDPKYPHAWSTPEFRAWMLRKGGEGFGFLLRNGNASARVVFPPSLTGEADWIERDSEMEKEKEHSFEEIIETLNEAMP